MLSAGQIDLMQTFLASLFLIFAIQLFIMPNQNWQRFSLAIVSVMQGGLILGLNIVSIPHEGQLTFVGLLFFMLLLVNMTSGVLFILKKSGFRVAP